MGTALSCFITDERFGVETFALLVGCDALAARAFAEADLRDNPHHTAVEVREGETVIFVLRRQDSYCGARI